MTALELSGENVSLDETVISQMIADFGPQATVQLKEDLPD
jgi:hypothetical protein